jgi:hypothetical protein
VIAAPMVGENSIGIRLAWRSFQTVIRWSTSSRICFSVARRVAASCSAASRQSSPILRLLKPIAGSLPGVLVEALPKKLPNSGYARRDANILGVGTKDCGGGIPTEQPEYAKLESRGNNQDERRKVEKPHAVTPHCTRNYGCARARMPACSCASRAVRARLT